MSIEKPDYSKEGIRRSALEALTKISERSDELPEERLTTEDPKSKYKCTNNCFAIVAFWLDHLIDKEVITNTEITEKFQKFIEYA